MMTSLWPKRWTAYKTYITKRMRVSFHLVVIAFFLFATVVTATVAISLQYVFSRNLAAETTLTLFETKTEATQKYLHEVDERASASVRIVAKYVHADEQHNLSKESLTLFTEVMLRNPLFHGMYIGFDNGDYFGIVNLDADKITRPTLNAEPTDRWVITKILGKGTSRKREMIFVNDKLNVRTTRLSDSDFKSQYRPWFKDATKDKVHKTAPYLFGQLQTPGATYSIRLPSKKAVLGVDITQAAISDYLQSQRTEQGTEMYLFHESGELVASSEQVEQATLPAAPKMVLSEAQQNLVEQTPYIRVSNETDWPPINFAASGEPYGYSVDVLNYLSQMTGIKINYVNGLAWNDMANMFLANELDVLQPVFFDPSRAWLGGLTKSFLQVPYGVLTAKGSKRINHIDDLNGKTVAIPEGWLLASNLEESFKGIKIVRVPNVRAMFDAVREGKVDAAMDTAPILNYTAKQYFIEDVVINTPLAFGDVKLPEDLHFMFAKDKPELKNLFDQALALLGDEQKQALANKWFNQSEKQRYHIGVTPYKELIRLAQQGGSDGLKNIELDGENYYVYVTPFGAFNDRKEYLAIISPTKQVLASGLDKVIDAILITSVVLLFLLPLAWILAGPFVKPIQQLAKDSKNIAHRRYDDVGKVDSRIAEVHDLAVSMGEMSTSIQNHEQAQRNLRDAFIKVIAQAIDDKSAHTAGHCERVPQLALMLVDKADKADNGIFKNFKFESEEQWREFEVAAWLHDCGKITTPEHIIDKGTKLETIYNRIHEIRMRFEVLWRDCEIEYYSKKAQKNADETQLLAEKQQKQQQLQQDFAFIANANVGGEFIDDADVERLHRLAETTWQRHFDDRLGLSHIELARYTDEPSPLPATENLLADKQHHIIERTRNTEFDPSFNIKMNVPKNLYNMGELYNLAVSRGTLTEEDRFKINEHIISTIKMLENLPFPEELSNVPRYASTHHEKVDGNGYPRKLSGEELSVPERVMVLADIFEALTAADRPYKKAKPISEAIKILSFMVKDDHVDGEVFELFLKTGVYLDYAKQFLPSAQIDAVDISSYLTEQ